MRTKKSKPLSDIDSLNEIVISAVRYALGRRTYIVAVTTNFIEKNIDILGDKTIAVIIRDISEAGDLGDYMDEQDWNEVLVFLKKEQARRAAE